MAERRMFSKPLTSSELFLEMPKDAQLLYFHLALDADDDGFINSPNKIIRCVGCQKSDMEVLIKKGYLKLFESGIAVIVHWKIHNYIQKDRYKETIYQKEKQQLVLYGKKYVTKDEYTQSVSNEDTSCVSILETQDRLDKNNEEQNRLELDGILEKIENKKVREKFESFVKMRENNSSPLTPDALKILINKAEKLTTGFVNQDETIIKILEKSIINNYKDIFPIEGNNVQIKSTFEDVDLNKIENNESEEQLYKDWLESNNLLDQGVRDAYKNSIENKFKELYHDDINSYHSRKLNS